MEKKEEAGFKVGEKIIFFKMVQSLGMVEPNNGVILKISTDLDTQPYADIMGEDNIIYFRKLNSIKKS